MKIANGVEMLSMSATLANGLSIIHPTIIWDNDNLILVDAGLPGQLGQLRDEAGKFGISFEKLNKIIITHSDMDHIGGLASLINEFPAKIEVIAHEEEKAYIQGERPPIRLAEMEAKIAASGGDKNIQLKMLYDNLKANYRKFSVKVDKTVADGEKLPYCGGIEVVFTPGHTPGHICLYLRQSKTLIAGDILQVINESLVAAPDFVTTDKKALLNSLKNLSHYEIETVICYHGGSYSNNVNDHLAGLVSQ